MLLALTVVVSGHKGRLFRLTQTIALLEKRVAELEGELAAAKGAREERKVP